MTINKPEPEVVAWRWRKPVVNDQGETVGATAWELSDAPDFLPWWTNDPLIRLSDYERLQADHERLQVECEKLRKQAASEVLAAQEENQVDKIFDAVLNCPHSITHESVTLHFYPRQKEGHNALAQLHHRIADYDLAARQREMQLLGEIEALERLALNVLKQLGEEAAPQAAVPKIDRESAAEKIAIEVADNCGNWLTVVYRDIQPGDEARAIVEHPKASALSWSHALRDRDTAIAAQAKQGEQH